MRQVIVEPHKLSNRLHVRPGPFHGSLPESLQATRQAEVLQKRANDEQKQNQQIEIEEDCENGLVFVDQGVVGLRRFVDELVQPLVEARLQSQDLGEPSVQAAVDVQQDSALEIVL